MPLKHIAKGAGFGLGAGVGSELAKKLMSGTKNDQPTSNESEAPAQQTDVPQAAAPTSGVSCGGCGTVNAADRKFCSGCGSKLEEKPFILCKCGARIDADKKFCTGCGSKLEEAEPVVPDAPDASKTCQCGVQIEEGKKFCSECGSKWEEAVPDVPKACQCGVQIEEGKKFCSECGSKWG